MQIDPVSGIGTSPIKQGVSCTLADGLGDRLGPADDDLWRSQPTLDRWAAVDLAEPSIDRRRGAECPSLRSNTCTNLTASPRKRRTAEDDPSSAEMRR